MCPFCKDKQCKVSERPDGKLVCDCGKHSWPNAAIFAESLRTANPRTCSMSCATSGRWRPSRGSPSMPSRCAPQTSPS